MVGIIVLESITPRFGTWCPCALCGLSRESEIAVFLKIKIILRPSSQNYFLGLFLIGLGFGDLLQLCLLLILLLL